MSARRQALALYRKLLREAEKLPTYNFRNYAARKIRDSFRANRATSDFDEQERQLAKGWLDLELIRRQAIIGHLYTTDKLVIEQSKKALRHSED